MIKPFRGEFRLTQGFGGNPASYAQFGLKGHNGLDYGLPTGTQIIAPHNGKVIEVADEGTRGYGKYIKIENEKEGSVMAHLSSFQVKVGDTVSEGQPIALSGNTGNSTGPHLHWGYYLFPRNRQNGYAGFIDQINLIAKPPTQTDSLQQQLDKMRTERDKNWNLYVDEKSKVLSLTQKVKELETKISNAKQALS
jgi:murein DD-endopeptidase MepM/ murein hydrolase activator NlpD